MDLASLFSHHVDVPALPEGFDARQLPSHGGVWLLADEEERPIQLGGCENLRRSVGFRMGCPTASEGGATKPTDEIGSVAEAPAATSDAGGQSIDDKRRPKADVRSITHRIWWWPTYSQFETAYDYHRIARQIYPDRYRRMISFGPSWFIRIDLTARIPRPTSTEKVFGDDAQYFGPFATRALCNDYIELLQDLFNLCRHPDVLEKVPRGTRCAYYDMGKCTAPCDGTSSMDRYRGLLAYAVQFMRAGPSGFIAEAEQEMRRAAAAQEFERAAATKRRIEQARKAHAGPYRLVGPADGFTWLILQRAEGRAAIKPFWVRVGLISRGEPVAIKKVADHLPGWLDVLRQGVEATADVDRQLWAEHVWLVSHFLYRADKVPGLYLKADSLPQPDALGERIQQAFVRQARPRSSPGATIEDGPVVG